MKRRVSRAIVIAWWFLSVGQTYGPGRIAIPVGPFATEEECRKVMNLVNGDATGVSRRNYTSWCWWDGQSVPTPIR